MEIEMWHFDKKSYKLFLPYLILEWNEALATFER